MMKKAIDSMKRDLSIQLLPGILATLRIAWRSKHIDAAGKCLVSLTLTSGTTLN